MVRKTNKARSLWDRALFVSWRKSNFFVVTYNAFVGLGSKAHLLPCQHHALKQF